MKTSMLLTLCAVATGLFAVPSQADFVQGRIRAVAYSSMHITNAQGSLSETKSVEVQQLAADGGDRWAAIGLTIDQNKPTRLAITRRDLIKNAYIFNAQNEEYTVKLVTKATEWEMTLETNNPKVKSGALHLEGKVEQLFVTMSENNIESDIPVADTAEIVGFMPGITSVVCQGGAIGMNRTVTIQYFPSRGLYAAVRENVVYPGEKPTVIGRFSITQKRDGTEDNYFGQGFSLTIHLESIAPQSEYPAELSIITPKLNIQDSMTCRYTK